MARGFWGVSVAAYVTALVWAWRVLPEQNVVQHLGPGGPDRWGSRTEHLGTMAAVALLTIVLMPVIVRAVSAGDGAFVNIPHKDYWFAPERRTETQAVLRDHMWWFLAATNLLLVVTEFEIVRVTLGHTGFGWWPMAAYLAFTGAWIWQLSRRFRRPPTVP